MSHHQTQQPSFFRHVLDTYDRIIHRANKDLPRINKTLKKSIAVVTCIATLIGGYTAFEALWPDTVKSDFIIKDENLQPVAGATVDVYPSRTGTATTDSNGVAVIDLGKVYRTQRFEVTVSKPGFRTHHTKLIISTRELLAPWVTKEIMLIREPVRVSINLWSTPSGDVWINGERVGKTPYRSTLPVGTHEIEIRSGEAYEPYRNTLQVRPNEPVTLATTLLRRRGYINVVPLPHIDTYELRIDDHATQEITAPVDIALLPGLHHIEVRHPDYGVHNQSILLKPGQRHRIVVDFRAPAELFWAIASPKIKEGRSGPLSELEEVVVLPPGKPAEVLDFTDSEPELKPEPPPLPELVPYALLDPKEEKYIDERQPEYPSIYRRKGIRGEVEVEVVVDLDGYIEHYTITKATMRSKGHDRTLDISGGETNRFIEAVEEALKSYRFMPGTYQGQRIKFVTDVRFVF